MEAKWFVNYSEESDEQGNGVCGLAIGPHEEDFADTFAFSRNFPAREGIPEEIDAKFRLIAAAPELLEICKRLVDANVDTPGEIIREAQKVILKATGEPQP